MKTTKQILEDAKRASRELRCASENKINTALLSMAATLSENEAHILAENEKDIEAARGVISDVMIDRLRLSPDRIAAMARGIREIAALPSPLGKVLRHTERPNGLIIERISAPLGVIAIIYESRPNVTSDAAALALKSGNACVLRGGKEAYNSSRAITDALVSGIKKAGLPDGAVELLYDTTRAGANELMTARGYVDLLIPRGGAGLINACVENAKVPCLETGTGICHLYVDRDADFEKALNIAENGKTSRPSVCNALEVLLVHRDVAEKFLPLLKKRLTERSVPVELRLSPEALKIIDGTPASEGDFDTEFLDYIMAVKVVSSAEEAVAHIEEHSTHHSEAIVTENEEAARFFTDNIDSAAVYVNASTRFTDGGEFGLGCEMGISTQKMHARGPLGIEELTTYKYIVRGDGQIR